MNVVRWTAALSLVLFIGSATRLLAVETWSEFQNGGALVMRSAELPTKWSPDSGIAWNVKLAGYGQSSPLVFGDQIYVTSVSGAMKENLHVQAMDRRSGKEVWRYDGKNSSPEKNTSYVSRAAPSPVCDEAGVIASFEGGNVVALDHQGKVRWKRDLAADYGAIKARHGLSSSLAQNAGLVFVWIERQEKPYIAALKKSNGETAWKADGVGGTSWSSPRLAPVAGGDHLVCSASGRINGYDPSSGKLLWTFDGISNNTSCTPIPLGDGRFLIGASDGRGNASGSGAASNGVIQIAQDDKGVFEASFVWTSKKASSSFGSPIVVDDRVCIVNRAGVLFQLDVKTGKQASATRVAAGGIWATPLVAGDNLYLFGYKGVSSVYSLSRDKEIAENRLWTEEIPKEGTQAPSMGGGKTLYAAAVAGSHLILRRGDMLYAVGAKTTK